MQYLKLQCVFYHLESYYDANYMLYSIRNYNWRMSDSTDLILQDVERNIDISLWELDISRLNKLSACYNTMVCQLLSVYIIRRHSIFIFLHFCIRNKEYIKWAQIQITYFTPRIVKKLNNFQTNIKICPFYYINLILYYDDFCT